MHPFKMHAPALCKGAPNQMTESHQTLDPFAEIARREHPHPKEGMSESLPAVYEKRLFGTAIQTVKRLTAPSFEAELSDFHEQLSSLREKYRPYLQNLVPPRERMRPAQELKTFDFRYRE